MSGRRNRIVLVVAALTLIVAVLAASIWVAMHQNSRGEQSISLPPDSSLQQAQPAVAVPGFRGKITDARTHAVIGDFIVRLGSESRRQKGLAFFGSPPREFHEGSYFIRDTGFDGSTGTAFLRIEASGYLPVVSQPLHQTSEQDFVLQPAENIHGVVTGPDGKRVAGAVLIIGMPGAPVFLHPDDPAPQQRITAKTGTDGAFELWPQIGPFQLAVLSDQGFAILNQDDLSHSTAIHLAAWGRIAGHVTINGNAAAAAPVSWEPQNFESMDPLRVGIYADDASRTDANGDFHFDRVPPGIVEVQRLIFTRPLQARAITRLAEMQEVTVTPGATATVHLGRGGRQVVGRLVTPENLRQTYDFWVIGNAIDDALPGTNPVTTEPATWARRGIPMEIDDVGRFIINDVTPGNYTIHVAFDTKLDGPPIAFGTARFRMNAGDGALPLSIPDIPVQRTP